MEAEPEAAAVAGSEAAARGIGTETEGCTGASAGAVSEESRCCAAGELVAAVVDGVPLAAVASCFEALDGAVGLFAAGSGLALLAEFVPASAKDLLAADEEPDVAEPCGKLAA